MLPELTQAQPTLVNLHSAARLLGALRLLVHERQPNYLELGLRVVPVGLATDLLPGGGEVTLDFIRLALVYRPQSGAEVALPLAGQTQAALLEALLAAVHARELVAVFPAPAAGSYSDAMFAAAEGFVNRIQPKRADLTGTATLAFDAPAAADYARVLYAVFSGVARFRARLNGALTPIVVWPEHFDLSFLWFAAQPDEAHPHLSFGFAPFSAGIAEPYLYAYAYPYPAQYAAPSLPAGARWHTAGWTGMVLPYSAIAQQADAEAYIEASSTAVFRALRPLLA